MASKRPSQTPGVKPPRDLSLAPARSRNWQRLGYRRIVQLLVYLVIIPTGLLLSIGILMMFLEGRINLLFGILTVSFVAAVVTGVVLVIVFVRREANLSELQADFVSKVSHELRTPLTAIRLFAETMERSKGDPETVDQCLRLLVDESNRLTRLIERLLDWGRMEAGRKLYDLRTERVSDVIDEATRAFSLQRFSDQDLKLEVDVDEDLPLIRADKGALVDAIGNLLSNARKYGGTPPIVKIRAEKTSIGDVRISVTDNGDGIELAEQRRIFQKFYRIDDRLSRTREGSGLGLAIVKHIARAHDAQVDVTSEKGKGATFSLIIGAAVSTKAKSAGADASADADENASAAAQP